jgi:hypothetical protein
MGYTYKIFKTKNSYTSEMIALSGLLPIRASGCLGEAKKIPILIRKLENLKA